MLTQGTLHAASYLDVLSTSQRATAANVANADTPGYRTLTVDFEAAMRKALGSPAPEAASEPAIVEHGGLPVKNDGNDVNLDQELRTLSENAIRFSHGLLLMRSGIRKVRQAIQEGRGA